MSYFYLAYGSNLHPGRLTDRVNTLRCCGPATIPGFHIEFNKKGKDNSGKANLVATPGGAAYGAVYHINNQAKTKLDEIEGQGYRFEPVPILLGDTEIEAYAYIARRSWTHDSILPFDWYHALVMAGIRYWQFPAEYANRIEGMASQRDSALERADFHQRVLVDLKRITHTEDTLS